jgi:outer membrane immunogenic protein
LISRGIVLTQENVFFLIAFRGHCRMKKSFLTGIVASALLTGPALAAPPPSIWTWSGFYIGAQGGYGWDRSLATVTAQQFCGPGPACGSVTPPQIDPNNLPFSSPPIQFDSGTLRGPAGGVTVGWNWQNGRVIFGVEGDASWGSITGTHECLNAAILLFGIGYQGNCSSKLRSFQTVTGRVGLTVDRALWYVKAGGAAGQFNHQVVDMTSATPGPPGLPGPFTDFKDSRLGYTVGVGIEYALWNNWSVKLEYDYMDFGTKNIDFPLTLTMSPGVTWHQFANDRERVSILKGGLNWRFNWN